MSSVKEVNSNVDSDFDLNRYTNLKDMYGYIGFVDINGGFYRVRKIGSLGYGHGRWAYNFLDNKKNELGIEPSEKLYKNILALLEDPKLKMAILYEISDSSMGEYSKIEYNSYGGEMDLSLKQKDIINHLIDHQNEKSEQFQNTTKTK